MPLADRNIHHIRDYHEKIIAYVGHRSRPIFRIILQAGEGI